MKTAFFLFFLLVMLASLKANAGLPPTTLGGQQSASKPTTFNFKAPNYQATQTLGTTSLIETGNKNILANPSLEHPTVPSGSANASSWIASATSISLSTAAIDGSQALLLVSSAAAITATQDSTLYASELDDGVQCLAQVRVKTDTALQVCARQAGVTSTTDCVTTNTDNKWGLYKVPFICGATSNGISIASSGSVTGGAYIDDAFVGAVDIKADVDQSRIAGESYFAGTTNCAWSRTSASIGAFTADADCPGPTIVISTMGTWATTDSNLPRQTITNLPAGTYKAKFIAPMDTSNGNSSAIAINDGTTTCEAVNSNNTLGTVVGQIVECAFTYTSSGDRTFELYGSSAANSIRIQNAQAASPRASTKFILEYFGNNQIYSASCGANCVDTFSAKVSSAGVVSGENSDFINGNCVVTDTSLYTCSFNDGIFTETPNCQATVVGATENDERVNAQSTSSVIVRTLTSAAANSAAAFNIECSKTGADFVATRTIVGSFNEVMTVPGITKPKTCYYAFGGASATLASPTECTTGTCVEVVDTCGTGTPPSFSGSGTYGDITFAPGTWANSSFVHCSCSAFDTTTATIRKCSPYFVTSDNSWSTNSSGGYVVTAFVGSQAGTENSAYVSLSCQGQAP